MTATVHVEVSCKVHFETSAYQELYLCMVSVFLGRKVEPEKQTSDHYSNAITTSKNIDKIAERRLFNKKSGAY